MFPGTLSKLPQSYLSSRLSRSSVAGAVAGRVPRVRRQAPATRTHTQPSGGLTHPHGSEIRDWTLQVDEW